MPEQSSKKASKHLTPEDVVSDVTTVGGFSLSPDGLKVAFSWMTSGNSQVFISPLCNFKPVQLTHGSCSINWPNWSRGSGLIAYQQDEDGNECYNLYTVSPADGSVRKLTEFERSDRFRYFSWSPDGRYLAFDSNWEGSFDIYTIKADGTDLQRITSGSEQYYGPGWLADGQRLRFGAVTTFGIGADTKTWIVNRDKTGLRSIDCTAGSWSPDETRIAFAFLNDRGVFNVGVLNIRTGEKSWLTNENHEVWSPFWSPDGNSIACTVAKDGNWQIGIIELESGKLRIVGPLNGQCSCGEFTPDGKAMIFVHEGPRNPKDLWYLDLSRGKLRQLTNGCPDSIDRKKLVSPDVIRYTSLDGMEIPAFLFKPLDLDADVLPPAIVWVHGGPNYAFMNVWNPTVQLLVNRGYVVMAPNFRGSTGYGEEFARLSFGDWGGGDLKDIIAAAGYLESTGQADGKRIALWGGSYGGYLMLMALAKAPDRWAACVNFFGFVDLVSFYQNTRDWMRKWIEAQIGTPEENPEFYHERSPINHCTNITAPLLYFQGANDPRVPLSESEKLMSVLKSQNKDCTHVVYEDEGHGFQKKANQIDTMRKGLEFLERHLRDI